MHIAIVDDVSVDRQELLAFLQRYCLQENIAIEVTQYPSGEAFLADFVPGTYPLIFFDIYMTGITGMDVARQVCRQDPDCKMVFVTTSQGDAVTSYEVRAAWYLTKPLDFHRFSLAMDTVCKSLLRDNQFIALHQSGVAIQALLQDIVSADCSEGRVCLHLTQDDLWVDEKVNDSIEVLANSPQFCLCNRNVVVNMDRVDRIDGGDFLMDGGQRVPIRLRGQAAVKKDYLRYSLRHLREGGTL